MSFVELCNLLPLSGILLTNLVVIRFIVKELVLTQLFEITEDILSFECGIDFAESNKSHSSR